jgi:multiple sugar transport system permease protein
MTAGGPYGSSRVLAYYMYEQALSEYGYRMGYGTAIATVLFAIMLVYIVFVLWRIRQQEKDLH